MPILMGKNWWKNWNIQMRHFGWFSINVSSTRNQGSIKMTLWGTKKVWLVFFSATFNQGFLAFKTPYFKDENQLALAEICCLISQLGVCFCAIFNKIMKASWEHWKMASGRNQSAKSSHFLPYDTCAWVVQKWTIFS